MKPDLAKKLAGWSNSTSAAQAQKMIMGFKYGITLASILLRRNTIIGRIGQGSAKRGANCRAGDSPTGIIVHNPTRLPAVLNRLTIAGLSDSSTDTRVVPSTLPTSERLD